MALCLAAAVAVVVVQAVRKRRQLRHIPELDGHWPVLGRLKTLTVRSPRRVVRCLPDIFYSVEFTSSEFRCQLLGSAQARTG